eukprot:142683-Amphidinium_carterae.1
MSFCYIAECPLATPPVPPRLANVAPKPLIKETTKPRKLNQKHLCSELLEVPHQPIGKSSGGSKT